MKHIVISVLLTGGCAGALMAQDGAAIYGERCATCHDAAAGRVPTRGELQAKGFPAIQAAIETGIMKEQAAGLSSQERLALVLYLAVPAPTPAKPPTTGLCPAAQGAQTPPAGPAWNGWGRDATNSRFQPAAGVSADDVPRLRLRWAFGLGQGADVRSQPAIAFGRVFVGNMTSQVQALHPATGCVLWSFDAASPLRGGVVAGMMADRPAVFFADGGASAYALDAMTGEMIWKTAKLDQHFVAVATGTPLLHAGVLYVPISSAEEALAAAPGYECCTFRGSVAALDAATGERLWKTYTIPEAPTKTRINSAGVQMYGPSGAGVWSSPTFDEQRNAIYLATGDNYSDPPSTTSDAVLALDADTGVLLWSRQLTEGDAFNLACSIPGGAACPEARGPDFDFGQPPILVSLDAGKRALVIGQKSGMAHALDPDNGGEILWQTRVGRGTALGGSQWGSAADASNMYVAISDIGFTGAVPDPGNPMGPRLLTNPNKGGGLSALDLATGEIRWRAAPPACTRENCSPAQSAAVTVIPGVVFSGSVDGHLRAFSTGTGEIIWDVDTIVDYDTVNGVAAKGGSLNVTGPVIAGGLVLVNSGYGQFGGVPGNVLLAFSVDGE